MDAHRKTSALPYLLSTAGCALTALLARLSHPYLDLANTVMLFLLAVFLVARLLGRGPAVLAAFLSVGLFDFFFVPPQLSFTVADAQYLITFGVMLAVGLATTHLTANLGEQAERAERRERETRELYEVAKALAGALTVDQVAETAQRFLKQTHRMNAALFIVNGEGRFQSVPPLAKTPGSIETSFARTAADRGELLEIDALAGSGMAALYFPLRTHAHVRGVLAVSPLDADEDALHALRPLLGTLTSLMAIAVERLHYADVAKETELQMASERLRNSLLATISHDLRTPLTALVGMADSLAMARPPLAETQRETALALGEQARSLGKMVGNLLDMARLQSHDLHLNKEWQPLEEVVGAAARLLSAALTDHPLHTHLPEDLPLVEFDAVLLERVLCNLLENAAKYSPAGTPIELAAEAKDDQLLVTLLDRGVGFPAGREHEQFNLFARGEQESAKPGVGLGLAICKTIIEAHGGHIEAMPREGGGACVRFTLPLGTPPVIEEETT
ncbi:MAG TPA: DUF4118 domain-containing protein [Rhodocyclaceae bacterium]|nr:DUF4118 domain-containing protein [Rhodocyclaceae bacterium]